MEKYDSENEMKYILTMLSFFLTINHQVQFMLPNRESRVNRERSRLCNQERTLQDVTARKLAGRRS